MHRVLIQPSSYDNCAEAVDLAFEKFPLEIIGKKVMIKPNLLRSSSADEHIVTHPALLRAVVEKVETLSPAGIVVGDNPGLFGYGEMPVLDDFKLPPLGGEAIVGNPEVIRAAK